MSCSECFQGTIHDGVPQGKEKQFYGRSTYVAEPPDGSEIKGIIVIVSDALGWTFSNMWVLADTMAKEGPFRVYLPEFMNGWSLNASTIAGCGFLAHMYARKRSAVGFFGHC